MKYALTLLTPHAACAGPDREAIRANANKKPITFFMAFLPWFEGMSDAIAGSAPALSTALAPVRRATAVPTARLRRTLEEQPRPLGDGGNDCLVRRQWLPTEASLADRRFQ